MAPLTLSKSDFRHARTCPTKLYYRKKGYPTTLDDDPYLELLADGGYVVEVLARMLFPGGLWPSELRDARAAARETADRLKAGDVTLYEATVLRNDCLARVDVLVRSGNALQLLEIKSSSIDGSDRPFRGKKGGISSEWRAHLEDVTFQTLVVRSAWPELIVRPLLCVVDKSRTSSENTTIDRFLFPADEEPDLWQRAIRFTGDEAAACRDALVRVVDVTAEVAELEAEVSASIARFTASLRESPLEPIAPVLRRQCKACEYRITDAALPSGFRECWKDLADVSPHVLDLFQVRTVHVDGKSGDIVHSMAAAGRARLDQVPLTELTGGFAARQRIQIEYAMADREFQDPILKPLLSGHTWPHHFIDFETTTMAVPFAPGMHPYETTAFQWSCHTISSPGETLKHAEYLNTTEAYPNARFVDSLRQCLGDAGTVYVWSSHERTVLKEIARQLATRPGSDPTLSTWIGELIAGSRIVDLCELARQYYWHPFMKGRVSIKYVLPAVWLSNADLRADADFAAYAALDAEGRPRNPYDTLPPLPLGNEEGDEDVVKEGTGAIRIYQDLMYGRSSQRAAEREARAALLLQYCRLDTAAMVMIWRHWTR